MSRPLLLTLLLAAAPAFAEAGLQYLGPKPAERVAKVVTLAPSLTETVLALGPASLLTGVSRFDEAPEVAKLPRVGGYLDPSVEAVVALHPDLVLVQPSPGNRKAVEKIASLGVPVLCVPMQNLEQTLAAILEVGRALGFVTRAREVAARINSARAEVRARAAGQPRVRVLLAYGFTPLVVAGAGSFAGELLADAGGDNAAEGAQGLYPVYSVESALRSKVEVVIDASDVPGGSDKLRALPGLKEARWVKLPSKDLMHPGPHLGRGLLELYGLLHPTR